MFWGDGEDACGKREKRSAGGDISTATDKTEQPNKVIKEGLQFVCERSTMKPHVSPLPLSPHIAVSIC